jgi:hypothetical protein
LSGWVGEGVEGVVLRFVHMAAGGGEGFVLGEGRVVIVGDADCFFHELGGCGSGAVVRADEVLSFGIYGVEGLVYASWGERLVIPSTACWNQEEILVGFY